MSLPLVDDGCQQPDAVDDGSETGNCQQAVPDNHGFAGRVQIQDDGTQTEHRMDDDEDQKQCFHNDDKRIVKIVRYIVEGHQPAGCGVVVDNQMNEQDDDQQQTADDFEKPQPGAFAGFRAAGWIIVHGFFASLRIKFPECGWKTGCRR